MKKVYLLSLGCPRNLLDSEVLLALLKEKGFTLVERAQDAEIAIVNTCGFIQDAKEESIDAILKLIELKKTGEIKKLIVSGCLSQRYSEELMDNIKEIDGLFGTADFIKIPEALIGLSENKRVKEVSREPDFLYDHEYKRELITPRHFAYLKIQEGCSNKCSYCVIPYLKGPRRSREISSVIKEAARLKKEHDIKELVLIGQDTTSFGIDRGEKEELSKLLRELSPVMKDGWIRLLYTHPAHLTDRVIEVIAETQNICKYVDLPVQHISDRILEKMNRLTRKSDIIELINSLREEIKGVTLRSSVIVGFPGETEEEFKELVGFLEEVKFDRLGAFIYSQEEGTPAASFQDQISEKEKIRRFDRVMKLQQEISAQNNEKYLGKEVQVLIDEEDPMTPGQYIGRGQMDAPEVDGVVYTNGRNITVGDFAQVKITGTMEYDFFGETI